jgi:hypothetical protein
MGRKHGWNGVVDVGSALIILWSLRILLSAMYLASRAVLRAA